MRSIIIPARGGSKGIPRKNVKRLGGIPLIVRCVVTCMSADVDMVIVSTEDQEIADLAADAGATVCDRPADLATDTADCMQAVAHSANCYPSEVIAVVECTAPFLKPGDVDGCLAKLTPDVDMVVSAVPFHGIVCDEGGPINYHPTLSSSNRQDRAPQWLVSGHCFAFRPEYLQKHWLSGTLAFHPIESPYHVDLDDQRDWDHAEKLIEANLYRFGNYTYD